MPVNWNILDPNAPQKAGNAFNQGRENALARQDAGQKLEMNNMLMKQQRQGMADEETMRGLYQQSGGDIDKLRQGMQGAGMYKQDIDMGNQQRQQIRQGQEQNKATSEYETKKLGDSAKAAKYVMGIPPGPQREAAYQQATEFLKQQYPDLRNQPDRTLQDAEQSLQQLAGYHDQLSAKDALSQQNNERDYQMNVDKFGYQRQNDAAGRGVTMRGQDMADARGQEAQAMAQRRLDMAENKQGMIRNEDGSFSTIGGEGTRELSAQQAKIISEGKQLKFVLEPLKALISDKGDMFGPVSGRARSMNPYDREAQSADAELRRAAQVIGSFMEGGVLRKEDEIKYRKMLPQLTDTKEVAESKMTGVEKLLADKTDQLLSDYSSAGFNTSQFNQKERRQEQRMKSSHNTPQGATHSGVNPATGQREYFNAQGQRVR